MKSVENGLTIIAVGGFKGSGKDYVAELLKQLIMDAEIMAFATPMKEILSKIFNVSIQDFNRLKDDATNLYIQKGSVDKFGHLTDFRSVIQAFGSEAMKPVFGESVWADALVRKLPESGVVIISDFRFNVEHYALSKVAKVITVRVEDFNLTGDGHASEDELIDFNFDVRIDNTAKDDSIRTSVRNLVTFLRAWHDLEA